jgi:guanylate kinase
VTIPKTNQSTSMSEGVSDSMSDSMGMRADEVIANLRARRRPRLFVISGPSGVGKDSVIERLRDAFPDIYFAVTATTRPRRPGEIDGIHYFFMDRPSFERRLAEKEFLESAFVYDFLYGVPRSPVRQALARGQDVIVKVDVQGAESIRAMTDAATFIFLAPESMTDLLHRLRTRKSEDPDVLMERFQAASREMPRASDFDYVIFNETDRLDQTIDTVAAIICAERARVHQPEVVI